MRRARSQTAVQSKSAQRLLTSSESTEPVTSPSFATSTPARPKLPTLFLKELDRTTLPDGTERRLAELHFEGMEMAEGRKGLSESLGIHEENLHGLLSEITGVTQSRSETINCTNLNYAVSMIHGLQPKDQAEIMLATQMTVTHMAVMSEASLLRNATGHKSRDLHERTFNKLARTFTSQMAALKNHRSPHGQQKMVVEHVNVHEGGQAIVGHVEGKQGV